jgi:hypothetical protein
MLAFGPRHVHAGESGKSQLMVVKSRLMGDT